MKPKCKHCGEYRQGYGDFCSKECANEFQKQYEPKTKEDIESLKGGWRSDPCWDIEDTEGFEAHYVELYEYRKECEAKWCEEREAEEKAIDEAADKLGVRGLYRLVRKQALRIEELEEKLYRPGGPLN